MNGVGGSAAILRFIWLGFAIAVCIFQAITLAPPRHYVLQIRGWFHDVVSIAWPVLDVARLAREKMRVHPSTCLYDLLGRALFVFEF